MIDTHAHYDDSRICGIIPEVFKNGVDKIITCATNFDDAEKVLELCEQYDNLYAAVGVYPHETIKYMWDKERLKSLAMHKKVVAIGEIGLDYYYDDSPRKTQLEWLENQLSLANELGLPVTFHDRDAHGDTMNMLRKFKPKGAVHCFSGSVQTARETVALGMYIGVGGVLTFKNARVLPQVVEDIPLSRILLETDAPYMSPVPMRGKPNRSDYMIYTAKKIAEIKKITVDEVVNTTTANAETLFGFDKKENDKI